MGVMLDWIKTDEEAPPLGVPVLGFWPPQAMQLVVRTRGKIYNAPGYFYSERRNAPEYWAETPNLPER